MPAVMMMKVIPTAMTAIGASRTSSGWIDPGGEERRGEHGEEDPRDGDDADQDELLARHGRGDDPLAARGGLGRGGHDAPSRWPASSR